MTENYKYICKKCGFNSNYKSCWEKHISTILHKTGKRKKRSDYKEPKQCKQCEYKTKNKMTMKIHVLNAHSNLDEREEEFKYYCKDCDFGTFSNEIFEAHTKTEKHVRHIARKIL